MIALKKNIFLPILIWSCFSMAFFLPIHIGLSNLCLIVFFVASGYFLILKKQYVFRNPKILLFTLLPIFLLYIFGLFFTSPPFEGIKIIERNIAFLLCPLIIFFLNSKMVGQIQNSLFKGIVYGTVLSILILLVNNFLNYFATRPFPNFDDEIFNYYYTYYSFTDLLEMHPTYLGVYLIFAVGILLNRLICNKKHKPFTITAFFILSIGVVFINSRSIYLLYILVVISVLLYYFFLLYKQKRIRALLLSVIIAIAAVFLTIKVLSNTYIVVRFTNELKWELSDQVDTSYNNKTDADSRVARWQSAIEAIAQKPFFGYGTHSEKEVLGRYYKKNGLLTSYNNNYDAHSIYLSFLIEYGFLGLCILLFYLLYNLYLAITTRNIQYILLFLMICIVGCFESYLKNNAAITFVAIFGTVFLFSTFPQKRKEEKL